jgi:exodeoxyribonuclease III
VKIATWNVNSLRVRLEHVTQWLKSHQPDVLALQEIKVRNEDFPVRHFADLGYQALVNGQPTYNGVALLTRSAASDALDGFAGHDDPQRRVLGATVDGVRVLNLYVPNGQSVGSDKYVYKLGWLKMLHEHLAAELKRFPALVVLGDFNIAPEDRDVHDPVAWEGKVLCSEPERAALDELLQLGFADVFRHFDQPDASFSWWDYRAAAFRRNMGLRIDLILASKALQPRCTGCFIDREPRGWERPSDHVPVVAEFASG